MFKKASIVFILIASLLVSATALPVAAKVIKLAHLNPQNPFDIATAAVSAVFKNELEARTGGKIKVEIYPSGTLGNERETMEQVKAGITQSYIASVGGIAPFYSLIDITSMPFAYSSYEIGCALYDGPFGHALAEDIRNKTGIRVLGFIPQGFFQFTNSKQPIKTPADMKGLKMRTMNNPLRRYIQKHFEFRLFQEMGLTGTGKRILEIGCGSGYGAELLSRLRPASYVGIDLMPEQIELTRGIDLPNTQLAVMDATDLSAFGINRKDFDRIAQTQFTVNNVGGMAVVGSGYTDHGNGFG